MSMKICILKLTSSSELQIFYDNDDIVAKMKKIVPEFKSMNSAFEILDK
jgi:hypothetical protein